MRMRMMKRRRRRRRRHFWLQVALIKFDLAALLFTSLL